LIDTRTATAKNLEHRLRLGTAQQLARPDQFSPIPYPMLRNNSLDQSARTLLIYIDIAPALADFIPWRMGDAGERTAPERAKPALEGATVATGDVRSLPHEPATTRGFWRDQTKKSPNREWLGLWDWWRRRELNPRPLALCLWLYMLSFRLLI
jgi:hypothetical protein